MKVLFVGDVHVKSDNLCDVEKLIEKIHTVDADIAVLAGDILDTHERVNVQLMNKAIDLIDAMRIKMPTFVLVGNHDYIDNSQFCTSNHWMAGIKRMCSDKTLCIVDRPMTVGSFIMTPYTPPGRFTEALDIHVPGWTSSSCIFAHQEFRGCRMGAIVSTDGDTWSEHLPRVISGHIHEKQQLQSNVYYPGSALNHSFGYDSQGLSVFEINNMDVVEHPIPLDLQKKRVEYMSIEQARILKPPFDRNVRYNVRGTIPEIASFKKTELYKQIRSVCKIVFSEVKGEIVKKKRTIAGFKTILVEKIAARDSTLQQDYRSIAPSY